MVLSSLSLAITPIAHLVHACAVGDKVVGSTYTFDFIVYLGKAPGLGQAKLIISFSSYVQEFPQAGGWLFILFFVMNIIKCHHEFH